MRVTQNSMVRNYLRTVNTNLSRLAKSEERMLGQKYSKASESVADTTRALRVRQTLFDNELYASNIRDVSARLSSAESQMTSISEILVSAREQLMSKGANDTNASVRDTIATEIDSMKDELIQFMNAQFSDSYLFGGTENGEAPFKVGDDGRLTYHGYAVDDIYFDDAQGKYMYQDPNDPAAPPVAVPEDRPQFVDVGMGLTMTGNEVDAHSAFQVTFSGLDLFGCGKNQDGVSNNIFNMLTDASKALRAEPYDREASKAIGQNLKSQNERLLMHVSELGTKTQFLETTSSRIEDDNLNLHTLQQKLEVSDIAQESMNWTMYTALMSATYRFGSQVLPNSLMDFLG